MFTKNNEFDYDGFMDWLQVNLLREMLVDDRTADQEAADAQLAKTIDSSK